MSRTPPADRPVAPSIRSSQAGLSMIETMVCASLSLVIAIGAYDVVDWSKRSYMRTSDGANARAEARATLDLMTGDIRGAGYNPVGAVFTVVPNASATAVRVRSDRDGDGTVGGAEPDEDVTWQFQDAGAGTFRIVRGVDLNGDGDFLDTGESSEVTATDVVRIDNNGDGTLDPFLTYDRAAPETNRVSISYGVRNEHRDILKRTFPVTCLSSDVTLRNKLRN